MDCELDETIGGDVVGILFLVVGRTGEVKWVREL